MIELIDPNTNRLAFRVVRLKDLLDFKKMEGLNYYSIFLVLQGTGKIFVDFSAYAFTPGNLLCISLYQPFKCAPKSARSRLRNTNCSYPT